MGEPSKMTESRPVKNVVAAVISTGDTTKLPSGTIAETPGVSAPNIVVKVFTPFAAIAVRFANAYLTTLVGLLTAGLVGKTLIPSTDFYHLALTCAGLSFAGPVVDLLKNVITILGRLEGKYPLLTGSI